MVLEAIITGFVDTLAWLVSGMLIILMVLVPAWLIIIILTHLRKKYKEYKQEKNKEHT